MSKSPRSHGDGVPRLDQLDHLGEGVVIEPGVLIFHPETVRINDHVYIGHQTILKGYYQGHMVIGRGSWVGQRCFLHSAGGIDVGERVGIAPEVKIITSVHDIDSAPRPVMDYPLKTAPVYLGEGVDVGVGSIVLPGVRIGAFSVIGAGSVVTKNVPEGEIWAGSPARKLRNR